MRITHPPDFDFTFPPDAAKYIHEDMNKIPIALILLGCASVFAKNSQSSINSATNILENTNQTASYKPHKPPVEPDACTGATHKGKKQK